MNSLYRTYQRSGLKPVDFLQHSLRGKIHPGYCPICEGNVTFIQKDAWLRDYYFCLGCQSIPRQRAIVIALNRFVPNWRNQRIHESSPGGMSSTYIQQQCADYVPTQFFPDVPPGESKYGVRCENLEQMTFEDQSFDLMISQDVFEHVMHPQAAFKEIDRILRPGGAHIFTIPWYPNLEKTVQRAKLVEGTIEFLEEPVYHGNPISAEGSLVTYDWGLDFADIIYQSSGMATTVYLVHDKTMGLEAEFLEVFISRKIK